MASWPRVSRLGEETWLVEYEPRLDAAINARVHQLAHAVADLKMPAVRDVVPAMASVAVHVDAHHVDDREIETLLERLAAAPAVKPVEGLLHELPVCYEPPYALDIEDVARRSRCAPSDVIEWHYAREYRVFMIGFLPGFPYLGVLDARLNLPRRDVPRQRVPVGSVAIAGEQTGIYPSDSPGGWHVIGRTPARLFDATANPPALLSPGDRVRFVPVPAARFEALSAHPVAETTS
jgi:KipI family sensor histidine kinase inhibitor